MTWNKLNVKSVILLYEYMHRDVYDTSCESKQDLWTTILSIC